MKSVFPITSFLWKFFWRKLELCPFTYHKNWYSSLVFRKTTCYTPVVNVWIHNFLLLKTYFNNNVFSAISSMRNFFDGFSCKVNKLIFLEIQTINYSKLPTNSSIQCLNRRFFFIVKMILNCPILCLIPRKGDLVRGEGQKLHICRERLDKQTQFSFSSIMVSTNKCISAKRR